MSTQIWTPFLTLAYLKHSLGKTDTTSFDNKIVEIIDRSNEQVDNDINPHITTPVDSGDPIFSHCRTLALRHAKVIWADEVLNDLKKIETYQTLYDSKLESVINELKARRTDKHESVLISHDPRDAKVILPSAINSSFFD